MKRQTTVSAHLNSNQILLFDLEEQSGRRSSSYFIDLYVGQIHKGVTVYLKSEQLLAFGLVWQYSYHVLFVFITLALKL